MKTLRIASFVCFTLITAAAFAQIDIPNLLNYQGRLVDGTNLVNGNVEITFHLWDAPTGSGMGWPGCTDSGTVSVVDGLYSTYIGDDVVWGSVDNALNQTQVWIEVIVGTNVLSPREQLLPVGYSHYAAKMPANAVKMDMIAPDQIQSWHIADGQVRGNDMQAGTISNAQIAAGAITSDKIGTWAISNVNLAFGSVSSSVIEDGGVGSLDIAAGAVRSNHINWAAMPAGLQDGDDGMAYTAGTGLVIIGSTIAVSNGGIGTVQLASSAVSSNNIDWASMPAGLQDGDDSASYTAGAGLDLVANEFSVADSGVASNMIDWTTMPAGLEDGDDAFGAVGYAENGAFVPSPQALGLNSIALGQGAVARADYSVVGGGRNNVVSNSANYSTIAGGDANHIGMNANYAAIAGGTANRIAGEASYTAIGGGSGNILGYNAWYASIGGGYLNLIDTNAQSATIAGGYDNRIDADSRYAVIAGGLQNRIYPSATNAAIGGGQSNSINETSPYAVVAGGFRNKIFRDAESAAIGGGGRNTISNSAAFAVIDGGENNCIGYNANYSVIGGGEGNDIRSHTQYSTVAGGDGNLIPANVGYNVIGGGRININEGWYGTVAGGEANNIQTYARHAAIGGGRLNTIQADADFAAIPGGRENSVGPNATNAFAAGCRAQANHPGAFVWGDSTDADITSAANNSVTMRAAGGYRLFSNGGATLGAELAANATSWSALSDRNAKENFEAVDTFAILEKVSTLPLTAWNYIADPDQRRYIGPVAQDFHAAFGLGNDTSINTLDTDGVTLVAIQGLYQMMREKDAQISELQKEIEYLKNRIK